MISPAMERNYISIFHHCCEPDIHDIRYERSYSRRCIILDVYLYREYGIRATRDDS
jgi:hypothetical protein